MKCDFRNVSSLEFEKLSSDILSKYLKREIVYFKEGRDEGIDFASSSFDKSIVGQSKRYNTSFNALYDKLKEEVDKVKTIKPDNYFLFVALDLSPQEIEKIYKLFTPYMKDKSNIFYKSRIEQLLDNERYEDVRRRHLSLFVDSLNLLRDYLLPNLSIDTSFLISSINEHKKLYVKTESYYKAKQTLDTDRVVLLTGTPGSGKTTISEMLILDKLEMMQDIKILYSTSNSINSIKDNMRACPYPMVILIDDFIGSTSLYLQDGYANEIGLLINYARTNDNAYLIINSRVNILNEGLENERLNIALRKKNEYLVNVDNLSDVEKAKIFKNHVEYYLTQKEIDEIMKDNLYLNIVLHKNYNPRIISEITNPTRVKESNINYVSFALNLLDHPDELYKAPFINLGETSRLLLETLYSFDSDVERPILRKAFDEVLKHQLPNHDNSVSLFDTSMVPLLGLFVKSTMYGVETVYEIANPSITEFIRHIIEEVPNKEKWFDSCIFFDQYFMINPNFIDTAYFKELFERERKYSLATYLLGDNIPSLLYVYKYGPTAFVDRRILIDALVNISSFNYVPINYPNLINKVLSKEMIDFYHFDQIDSYTFEQIVSSILNFVDYESLFGIVSRFTLDSMRNKIIENVVVNHELDNIINQIDFDAYFGIDEEILAEKYVWEEEVKVDQVDEYTFSDEYKIIKKYIPNYRSKIKKAMDHYDLKPLIEHYIEHGLQMIKEYEEGKPNTIESIFNIFSGFRKKEEI